eukprot:TRINITY_DN107665_c0_g1_i1.p1 TRINITY_DN107665_c0_g1~~TRINITY_DN107665_c0_g1_i1.p1  ORF type:complete len:448 (-),score=75.89 TRINITY_DN107665_c0_g1_i1:52-1395(-)
MAFLAPRAVACLALLPRSGGCHTVRGGASTRGDFATTSLTGRDRLDPGRRKRAFRADCSKVWGNLYDYTKSKFKDNHTPVEIRCPRHGAFWLRPRDHIQRKAGCPKCGHLSLPGSLQERAAAVATAGGIGSLPALGQHLLRSREVAAQIARAAVPDDEAGVVVAELGVGAGALTEALLERPGCERVLGFEVDEDILQRAMRAGGLLARHRAAGHPLPESSSGWSRQEWSKALEGVKQRCLVFKGDFLSCTAVPGDCQVAAGNVPYRISTALASRLLCQEPPLRRIVLTVQAEFARKLLAKPGSPKFSRVSALAAALCSRRELALPGILPPEAFTPPPRVDSMVVRLEPNREVLRYQGKRVPPRALEQVLRLLLDHARGTSRGLGLEAALAERIEDAGQDAKVLPSSWRMAIARAGLDPGRPAVTLQVEDFVALTAELCALGFEGSAG